MAVTTSDLRTFRVVKPLKRRLRRFWKLYLKWPAPLWRVRGYANLSLAGYKFKFPIENENVWWARRVRQGKWERGVRDFLKQALRPGDVFFDVGAWTGGYTVLASRLVETGGKVYSFEPDPVARRLLERTVRANKISNVTIVPYAVTGRNGPAWLETRRIGGSESTVSHHEGSVEIHTITLTSFCEKYKTYPSAVKLTAMGAEPEVFAEAMKVLEKARVIVLHFEEELLRRAGADPSAFLKSLFDLGRRILVLIQQSDEGPQAGSALTRESAAKGQMKLALLEPTR